MTRLLLRARAAATLAILLGTVSNAAADSIQKIEQFLDQVQQTENATRLAAISGRA